MLATSVTPAAPVEATTMTEVARPSTAGTLRVKGTKLVDESDAPVVLKGISTHGLAWFPGYVNQAMFDEMATWGANVVRLALYTEEHGGWCTGGDQAALKKLVLEGVEYARNADLYVIVDWHTLSDNDPTTHLDEAKAFFADVTAELGDDPHVLYEVCNEPNGATDWATVKSYAEQVIPVVRERAPHAVCLVGTPEWCQRPEQAAADPLSFDNVLYTTHFYAATHGSWLRDRMAEATAAGLPVFVSEFGICDASGNGAIDEDEANAWISFLDEQGIGRVMWNLSNKDESSAIVASTSDKTSGLGEGDLSQAGRWVVAMLGGKLPEAASGTVPNGSATIVTDTSATSPTRATNTGAAEARYAAGDLSYTAKVVNSWQEDGQTVFQYELSVTNEGDDALGWEVTVPFSSSIALKDGWNARYFMDDTNLVVANESYNAELAHGSTVTGIGFQVKGAADLRVVD